MIYRSSGAILNCKRTLIEHKLPPKPISHGRIAIHGAYRLLVWPWNVTLQCLRGDLCFVSQGRVRTAVKRGGQFCCSFVANFLQYIVPKIIKIHCGLTKLLQKWKGALVACPAVADETTILFNVTIAYILYFYVCLMYNKASNTKGKCILYSAHFFVVHARRSSMDHIVLPAITPMPAFTHSA